MNDFNEIDFNGILGSDNIDLDELNQLLEKGSTAPASPPKEQFIMDNPQPVHVDPNEPVTIKDIHNMMPKDEPEAEDESPGIVCDVDKGAAAILDDEPDIHEKSYSQTEFQQKIKIMSEIIALRKLLKKEKIDTEGIDKQSIKSDLIELNAELALLEYKYFYTMSGGINIVEQMIVGGSKLLENRYNGSRSIPLIETKPNLKYWSNSVAVLMRKRRYTTFKASNKILDLLGAKHGSFMSIVAELGVNASNQIITNSMDDKYNLNENMSKHNDDVY
jgi:hypothetical protein